MTVVDHETVIEKQSAADNNITQTLKDARLFILCYTLRDKRSRATVTDCVKSPMKAQ